MLTLSIPSSIGLGRGVLHPRFVFRVITRLVNSFMDSILLMTHTGHVPAGLQCISITNAQLNCIFALYPKSSFNMQVNTYSQHDQMPSLDIRHDLLSQSQSALLLFFFIHKNVLNRTNYNFSQLENTDYYQKHSVTSTDRQRSFLLYVGLYFPHFF